MIIILALLVKLGDLFMCLYFKILDINEIEYK